MFRLKIKAFLLISEYLLANQANQIIQIVNSHIKTLNTDSLVPKAKSLLLLTCTWVPLDDEGYNYYKTNCVNFTFKTAIIQRYQLSR